MDNSKRIKVKAMVDKEKNRVVFVECDEDFVDVLFSLMTIPMGTLVSILTEKKNLSTMAVGCMNKLKESVQNLDVKYFRTLKCQKMLTFPPNGAPAQCTRLKVSIDCTLDDLDFSHGYSYCGHIKCTMYNRFCYYKLFCDHCKRIMQSYKPAAASHKESSPLEAGVFSKGLNRLVITDDLQLMHPPSSASFSLLSKLGVMDATSLSALEVREFLLSKDEFLVLLKNSFVSKQALTRTLLHNDEMHKENLVMMPTNFKRKCGLGEEENGKIRVKLFISKSKKMVCFAEACEDFVDLVFSFLTIPLGHVLKQMDISACIEGCIDNVYKSIVDLDVEYFKSGKEKEMLVNPKLAPKFGYDNKLLLGIKEASCDVYFDTTTAITVKDLKIPTHKENKSNGGYMAGPTMFTVTDDLSVTPISAGSGLTILNNLDVPFSDIEERVVHVGNKEAVALLVSSFGTESALTHTFLEE